ncbi:MAG: twin-arginine translocase subunit TatB [Arsenophonus sp.]
MLEISFSEVLLIVIIGLIALGPERLIISIKTISSWILTLRLLAANTKYKLLEELKFQKFKEFEELQELLSKIEKKAGLQIFSDELNQSIKELIEYTELLKKKYQFSNNCIEKKMSTVKKVTTNLDEDNIDKVD